MRVLAGTVWAVGVLSLLWPMQALALSCASASYMFQISTVVFIGRPVSRVDAGKEHCDTVYVVDRVLKGAPRDQITLRSPATGWGQSEPDCSYQPDTTQLWLMFTGRDLAGHFDGGDCSGEPIPRYWRASYDQLSLIEFDRNVDRYQERLVELDEAPLPAVQKLAARAGWLDGMRDGERAADAYTMLSRERPDVMYSLRSSTDYSWRLRLRIARERQEAVRADELAEVDQAMARAPGDVVPAIIKALLLDAFEMHADAADAYRVVVRLAPDQWLWLALQAK
jgi:hypothetical protein